ncbi:hypothetical protein [Psychrobacter sp. I-STPA6b]|uniref:hypothetical protein n=1 Tax=Psychrobacter sp. I-STPA6b TaxID=2585718 RepID=UPI001D0CA606|nr:hypothetical protein [Psychrobacter sp. I-STPA6b]
MSTPENDALKHEIDDLENTMHETEQFHTLEEQVADMKRRGINPSQSYKKWDDDKDDDWGDDTWKENGKWEPKTSADLDEKARDNWDGDNGKANPPPFV